MSWGKIYCSTWWGDWRNIKNSILISQRPDCVKYIPPVPDYIARVVADGGTAEAGICASNSIENLKED